MYSAVRFVKQTRGYWQVFATLAYRIRRQETLRVPLHRACTPARQLSLSRKRRVPQRSSRARYVRKTSLFRFARSLREPRQQGTHRHEQIFYRTYYAANQKLSLDWRRMLGEDWREAQRQWLHRLGNLTLTGYNSSYSDRPFSEKKKIKGGFEESSVRLNKFVREQSAWTPSEMERRGKNLASRAMAVWPPLTVDRTLIDAAREPEMRQLSKQQDTRKVPMSEEARTLLINCGSRYLRSTQA